MIKSELRKLRALPATKEMMEKGKKITEETVWWDNCKRMVPEYDILVRAQNLNGYIKIAIFIPEKMRKDISTPLYEIFLNVAGAEYITRELDDKGIEKRWLSAMVWNLKGLWKCKVKIYMTKDAEDTLGRLNLGRESDQKGLCRLFAWQKNIKDERTKRKEEKEQAPWDEDMALIPKLPNGFRKWMRTDAGDEHYIFYAYDRKGQNTGYCSRCKRYVNISKPKHNGKTKCPSCGVKSTFKSTGKIKALGTNDYYGEIIQKIDGGIVTRRFRGSQRYYGRSYENPNIMMHEEERVLLFNNGTVKRYVWGNYKNKTWRWILDKGCLPIARTYWWDSEIKLYKKNFGHLKKTEILKQSAMDLWDKLPTSIPRYLQIEKRNPTVEKLVRIGMFRLAKDIIKEQYSEELLDREATELAKILKIDKSRLKRLNKMDGNLRMLEWLQYEKLANTIWPDEMIRRFGKNNFETSEFNFLNPPISFIKCYNYLLKQMEITGESMTQTLITWRDYINMADKLKMNTKLEQIQRPKDLKRAHDECILISKSKGMEKKAQEIEKKWPKVNEQLPKLKKFEFSDGDYTIIAPESVLDIVKEGVTLSHCVHTCDYYFDRIQRDESYLFFLRHSNYVDMPWYTLEVEVSGNIRQKRTTGDNQNKDLQKAVSFLKKWQKFFRKQLTEEEKEAGRVADELRKENYENLRKNGNKVWHGRLAGQLLADVLELDFMEVGG